jgi:hypothetical protein
MTPTGINTDIRMIEVLLRLESSSLELFLFGTAVGAEVGGGYATRSGPSKRFKGYL